MGGGRRGGRRGGGCRRVWAATASVLVFRPESYFVVNTSGRRGGGEREEGREGNVGMFSSELALLAGVLGL